MKFFWKERHDTISLWNKWQKNVPLLWRKIFLYWFIQNSSNSSQNSFKEPNQIKANGNVPRVQGIFCLLGTIPLQTEKCSHVFISQNVLSHLSHRLVILFNCNYIFYKTAAPQWVNQRVGVPNPPYFYHKKRIFFLFY